MSLFLPGKFHGQRCLVNYSPGGHKELDTTERAHTHIHIHTHTHTHTHNVFLTLNKSALVSIPFMKSSLNFLKP